MLTLLSFHLERNGLDVLSTLYIPPGRMTDFLVSLPAEEAVLIQTCNRWDLLLVNAYADIELPVKGYLAMSGYEAFLHLARVCAGLDSVVPGDTEIVAQVKQAFSVSETARKSGAVLKNTLPHILHLSKRIRSSYDLSRGYRSIAGLAASYINRKKEKYGIEDIAILGAGLMAARFASYAYDMGLNISIVANRSRERAEELAEKYGAKALHYGELVKIIDRIDALFCATAAPHPIITFDSYISGLENRTDVLHIVDVSIPSDVDDSLKGHKNIDYLDIQSLGQWQNSVLSERRENKALAEQRIKELSYECYKKIKNWYQRKQSSSGAGKRMG